MPNTRFIDLSFNQITELVPGSFASGVIMIDMYRNGISVIGEDLFANNTLLVVLYLDRNLITEIHHNFINSLPVNMQYVYLDYNECILGNFDVDNESLRMVANNALNQCFRNFVSNFASHSIVL